MIYYKSGYKYQLHHPAVFETMVKPEFPIQTKYLRLTTDGVLFIKMGYAWDGPSGPTVDTPTFMPASLMHDAMYQLFRMELLAVDRWRKVADQEMRRIALSDGMNRFRALYVYQAVRLGAGKAAQPESKRLVHRAPVPYGNEKGYTISY